MLLTRTRKQLRSVSRLRRHSRVAALYPWSMDGNIWGWKFLVRPIESFDSTVKAEETNSTDVVGTMPPKSTSVLASASVVNSVAHPLSDAKAQQQEAEANEEQE